MDVGAANPDVTFLTWAGWQTSENVGHFDGATGDGRYLDGLVAGSLTESGIIGYPVGFPYNEVNRAVNAFTIGVREVNPDAEVQVVYLNTWYDPSLEQQAAQALANAGADVLAHEVGSQVYATVMAEHGGHVIGYTNDWSDFEPEAWASSFLFDWGGYFVSQIESVLDGTWEPEITFGGLADGFIGFAPYGPDVSDETLALVEQRKQEIIEGTFDIFAGPILDNNGNEVIPSGGTIPFAERTYCCQWLVEGVVGSIPGATTAATEESAAEDFSDLRIVMLMDGSAEDGGWNTAFDRAADDIKAAFPGVQFEIVEHVQPGQTATNAFEAHMR